MQIEKQLWDEQAPPNLLATPGVEIPEKDYGKIASFEDAIRYVAARF